MHFCVGPVGPVGQDCGLFESRRSHRSHKSYMSHNSGIQSEVLSSSWVAGGKHVEPGISIPESKRPLKGIYAMMKKKSILLIGVCLCLCLSIWADTGTVLFLYTSDLHDYIKPGPDNLGGLPYVAGHVASVRETRDDILLLDGGDVMEKGDMVSFEIPVFVLSRHLTPPPVFLDVCNRSGIPILRSAMSTDEVISRVILYLNEEFAPETSLHGTAVDVYGVGCLILGKTGIGKSETALELIERGHRLIADDLVELKRRREDYLYAQTNKVLKHHMEIRGLGIVDVRALFGVGSVRTFKRIGLVVELEDWNKDTAYDRTGLSCTPEEILGVRLPYLRLPVRPGRNIAIIIEVAALDQRLKEMGINSAHQLNQEIIQRNRHQKP